MFQKLKFTFNFFFSIFKPLDELKRLYVTRLLLEVKSLIKMIFLYPNETSDYYILSVSIAKSYYRYAFTLGSSFFLILAFLQMVNFNI
jgi:hypothetical protein